MECGIEGEECGEEGDGEDGGGADGADERAALAGVGVERKFQEEEGEAEAESCEEEFAWEGEAGGLGWWWGGVG